MNNVVEAVTRFEKKFVRTHDDQCWLWLGALNAHGYGNFRLGSGTTAASRAAWLLYRGEIPAGLNVCHRCDVRRCVNPAHLFLGSAKDNSDDKIAKRRHAFGRKQGHAKLNEAIVREIRGAAGSHMQLGRRYGINQSHVQKIKAGKIWRHA